MKDTTPAGPSRGMVPALDPGTPIARAILAKEPK
jgi:hypothetical protein